MPVVNLLLHFPGGQPDLIGIDHHNTVACIDMGGVDGFCLPPQDFRQLAGQPAQYLSLTIHKVPRSLYLLFFGAKGLHDPIPMVSVQTKKIRDYVSVVKSSLGQLQTRMKLHQGALKN